MSRVLFACALILLATTVSAQSTANVTVWTNSVFCGTNSTTTDGLTANSTNFAVPTTQACYSASLASGGWANFTAVCNNATGVVTLSVFNDNKCTSLWNTFTSSAACIAPSANGTTVGISFLVGGCPIASNNTQSTGSQSTGSQSTGTNTNSTTGSQSTGGQSSTGGNTNGTTTKPSAAPSTGVSFSLMAAVAAVIAVALL